MSEYKIKYIEVGEELAEQIRSGKYLPGERFYSRKQLCELFRISDVTAVRVQNYLEERGLLRKQRGSGAFVNCVAAAHTQEDSCLRPLEKIITIREKVEESFYQGFDDGINAEIAVSDVDYELHLLRTSSMSFDKVNAVAAEPGAGYIIFAAGPESLMNSAALLMNPQINTVLLDAPVLGSHCVLSDSYDGMGKIVDYLWGKGCRHFIFAENCMRHPESFYSSERRDAAVAHCRQRGVDCVVISSGSYQDVFQALESHPVAKTAVMFPQDDHALRFKILAHSQIKEMPFVSGFDGYAPYVKKEEPLITVKINQVEMGKQTVKLLIEPFSLNKKIVRVPGTLLY